VHPPGHIAQTGHELGSSGHIAAERIENAYLQVEVTVHGRHIQIPAGKIHIVHQQTHPYAPVGGIEQYVGNQLADHIGVIQVILSIDAALGVIGQDRPGHKRIQAIRQQMEPGFPRVVRFFISQQFPEYGILRIGQRVGFGSIKTFWQCRAAGIHKNSQSCCHINDNRWSTHVVSPYSELGRPCY